MTMLFQTPPDTLGFMIAGYTVIFGFLLLYLISLVVRNRNLKRDIDVMQEIQKRESAEASQEQ
jgi:hypothetical protein